MSKNNVAVDMPKDIKLNNKPYYSHIFLCLVGVCFMAWFYYGPRVIILMLISALASFLTEIIAVKLSGKNIKKSNLTAVLSGIILSLLMPASLPYGFMAISSVMMIVIGKVAFGGLENQIFPCTAVGFALSSLCWSEYILVYPSPVANGALPLNSHTGLELTESFTSIVDSVTVPSISYIDLMLGAYTGPMGTTHIIVLFVCALTFMFRATASRMVFISSLATIFSFQYLIPTLGNSVISSLVYELLSGSTLFIIIFIACDPAIVPKKRSARLIYGILVGCFTVLFRRVGNIENAAIFGVLAACIFVSTLDKYFYHVSDFFAHIWSKRTSVYPAVGQCFVKLLDKKDRLSSERKEILKQMKEKRIQKAEEKKASKQLAENVSDEQIEDSLDNMWFSDSEESEEQNNE